LKGWLRAALALDYDWADGDATKSGLGGEPVPNLRCRTTTEGLFRGHSRKAMGNWADFTGMEADDISRVSLAGIVELPLSESS